MSTVLKFRRGDTTAANAFTGQEGELFVDTTKDTLVVHDGVTAGGVPLATESYVSSAISTKADSSSLATVATSGSYNDLIDKPTIPSLSGYATESYVNNQGFLTSVSWNDVSSKPSFATVATSGSYNDLIDKPTIPSLSGYATESYVGTQISNLIDSAPSALDTLNELAAALGDDANYATTVTNALAAKANSSDVTYVGTTQVALNRSSGVQALTGITSIAFGNSIIVDGTATIATASSNNVLDSFVASDYRTAKYIIQAISGTSVHVTEVVLTHVNTAVFITEYATIYTDTSLITVSANLVSGALELSITTSNNDTTVDFTRTAIAARTLGAATVAGDMMSLTGTEDLASGSGTEDLNV